jgi:Sec-independent protein translocase protein TatA
MTIAFVAGVGPLELAIVLLIVLVLVGGRRLPALDDESGRAEATAALGRPTGEEKPLDGEVMRERS